MKKSLFYLLVLLQFNIAAQDLSPGYMGKHAIVSYSNYFFPAFIGPSKDKTYISGYKTTLNSAHCLNLEYILGKNKSIQFSVQRINTGIDYSYGIDIYQYDSKVTAGKPANLKSYNFGLGLKFYGFGKFAPVGVYSKIELLYMHYIVTYNKNAYHYTEAIFYPTTTYIEHIGLGKGEYQYNTVAAAYTLGKQRILFDKLVLDYGIRFGVTPDLFRTFFSSLTDETEIDDTKIDQVFWRESEFRLLRQQTFNFHLGIGFLAF